MPMCRSQEIHDWEIRTPHVYRYLPGQYVDDFFENGRIRLSSFVQFASYKDEMKGDDQEGRQLVVSSQGQSTVHAHLLFGDEAYVLCGSTLRNKSLMTAFGATAAIHIWDTSRFLLSIARCLPGYHGGIEGFCHYKNGSVDVTLPQLPGKISLGAHSDMYFQKRLKYENQCEYRFIWLGNRSDGQPVTVECHEARKFCERVVPGSEDDEAEPAPGLQV